MQHTIKTKSGFKNAIENEMIKTEIRYIKKIINRIIKNVYVTKYSCYLSRSKILNF